MKRINFRSLSISRHVLRDLDTAPLYKHPAVELATRMERRIGWATRTVRQRLSPILMRRPK